MTIYFIVVAKDTFYTDPLQTWKDALNYCVYNQTYSFLSSISDFRRKNLKSDVTEGKFWTSTVRGLKFYNMKGNITTAEDELKEGSHHSLLFLAERGVVGGEMIKNKIQNYDVIGKSVLCRD